MCGMGLLSSYVNNGVSALVRGIPYRISPIRGAFPIASCKCSDFHIAYSCNIIKRGVFVSSPETSIAATSAGRNSANVE